jgi:hypothetical protein
VASYHAPQTPRLLGGTYSLQDETGSSAGYYATVAAVVDEALAAGAHAESLLASLRSAARGRRALRRMGEKPDGTPTRVVLRAARERLSRYLLDVEGHIGRLSWRERWGSVLSLSREQHLVAMVEVELTNRVNRAAFLACRERIALLPHCAKLHQGERCHARAIGLDDVCGACAVGCPIDDMSRILRRSRVKPYIWMRADLERFVAGHHAKGQNVGILGIACIPELVTGMRRVARLGVPVLGVPHDANRCARWLPERLPAVVNTKQLAMVLGETRAGDARVRRL